MQGFTWVIWLGISRTLSATEFNAEAEAGVASVVRAASAVAIDFATLFTPDEAEAVGGIKADKAAWFIAFAASPRDQ